MEIQINFKPLIIAGYSICKVPNDVFNIIKNEIEENIQGNFKNSHPVNSSLAGAIEHEYALINSVNVLENFVCMAARAYDKLTYSNHCTDFRLKRDENQAPDIWVNYQKKYEYNPPHKHTGDLSFVLWVKVPFTIEEEKKVSNLAKSASIIGSASFTFLVPTSPFMRHTSCIDTNSTLSEFILPVDKTFEQTLIIFPSELSHMVSPFYTSDDYRVSISGNLIRAPYV